MEPRTIAGLTISTEGPFVNLAFVDSSGITSEHMIPVSTMGRTELRTRPQGDTHGAYATLELSVDRRVFLKASHNGYGDTWIAGPGPNQSAALGRRGVSMDDLIAIRDALQEAYKVAGNFRRG